MWKNSLKQMHIVLQGSNTAHKLVFFAVPMRGTDADTRAKFGLFMMMCTVTNTVQTHGLSCAAASYSYQGCLENTVVLYSFGNIFTRKHNLKSFISFPGNSFLFSVSKSKLNMCKVFI